jgi:3',5'-cyclic AMP phosphodiesterase CpdA
MGKHSWYFACIVLTSACFGGVVRSHEGEHSHRPTKVKPAETYAPSAVPDRICLCCTASPATSMAVTWRTSKDVQQGLVQLAKATDGPGFTDKVATHQATSQSLRTDLGPARYHEATLVELTPETKYLYRVGDGENWSEWSEFQTASDRTDRPFSFVYFGDAQNDIKSHWSRVVRNGFREAPRAAFFLHAGDLVNRAESDAEWGEWFYASGFIHRTLPVIAVPGNHEMHRVTHPDTGVRTSRLSRHWRPTFAFPENGPAEPKTLAETCYFVDYHNVRIVALDSNTSHREQADYLKKVLADAPGWKIVTHHHPIYSASEGRDNPSLRELWQPIYDRYGVDLVLQGHDHTYARSGLRRHGQDSGEAVVGDTNVPTGLSKQSDSGTVYVVSVSGPKMYDLKPDLKMPSTAENTQLFQVIHVDGDALEYRAHTATGKTHDAFRLIRRTDQPNQLIELP